MQITPRAVPRAAPELSVAAPQRAQIALAGAMRGANFEGRRLEPMEAWGDSHAISPPDTERNPRPHGKTEERGRLAADRCTHIMTNCRHHSGYLADDEAGHITYRPRVHPPKRPPFLRTGPAPNLGHVPPPPSLYGTSGSSGLRSHRGSTRDPRPFGNFLDFLVEGQVLESLQRVVEEATERMMAAKTETGEPLVEVQDPLVEAPRGGRRARARPSLSTVHRHHAQPSLCIGLPNNYPSCSSSVTDSHSNVTAGFPGAHGRDSDLGYRGLGPLPPIRDRLLQEKSLKRLLRLENKGKRLSCSQADSLLWDSLGSSFVTPEASELGLGERELKFLKKEFNKEIKSLLSQSEAFSLPSYSSIREPHRTLDLLANHHLFPALQGVVNQAVDKLSGALRDNGYPLFPSEWEPAIEPNLESTPGSTLASSIPEDELYDDFPVNTDSSFKMMGRKTKIKTRDKAKEGGSAMPSAQGATRFRLQVIPTEEPKGPLPQPRQEAPDKHPKEQRPPPFSSGPPNQRGQPWRSLHLTLPSPGIKVEVPKQSHLTQVTVPHSYHHLPPFVPLTSLVRKFTPTLATLYSEVASSRAKLESLGANMQGKGRHS